MRHSKFPEVISVIIIISVFLGFLAPILFSCAKMATHDTLWFYGVFQFLAESLHNGYFPYWDPYDYSGSVFYPNLSIMHLFMPVTILLILINKLIGLSLFTLYHWNIALCIVTAALGVYLFARYMFKDRMAAYLLLIIFLFSSFPIICLRQAGFLYAFIWMPWVMLFFIRSLEEFNLYNAVGLGFFFGMAFNGYQGLYVLVYMVFFILTTLINHRGGIKHIILNRKNAPALFLAAVIFIFLCMPLLSVFTVKDEYIPMARVKTSPVKTDSFTNRTGSVPAVLGDFTGLINRDTAVKGYFEKKIPLSEGFLHIGYIGLMLAAVGLCFGRSVYKMNFILSIIFLFFIMLGEKGGVQPLINHIFPPFTFVRHMQTFAGFFIFNLLYFTGAGADLIAEKIKRYKFKGIVLAAIFALAAIDLLPYAGYALGYVISPRQPLKFPDKPIGYELPKRRETRVATCDDIRYFKPLLYRRHTAFNAVSFPREYSNSDMRNNIYALREKLKDGGFIFSDESRRLKLEQFFEYGLKEFGAWGAEDKLAFLDALYITSIEILKNNEFYSRLDGAVESAKLLRAFAMLGYKEVLSGRHDLSFKSEIMPRLSSILNLQIPKGAMDTSGAFTFMDQKVDFNKRLAYHYLLMKNSKAVEFVDYVWASSHVEEPTLLLNKDYDAFLNSGNEDKIKKEAGITSDIITFSGAAGVSYKVLKADPNTLILSYSSPEDSVLIFSDTYERNWNAYLDGRKVRVIKNSVFKAVDAPKGVHRVEFIYRPVLFMASLVLYYIAAVFSIMFLLIGPRGLQVE